MNSVKTLRLVPAVLSGLIGILTLSLSSPLLGGIPAGDLTVTVQELQNGEVQFSVSGTAFMVSPGSINGTNYSYSPAVPPANVIPPTYSYPLPAGLKLTVSNSYTSEPETPQETGSPTTDLLLSSIYTTTGQWYLGTTPNSQPLMQGASIVGSGSVTTSNIPFSFFVPGTYLVGPVSDGSEPEPSAPENSEVYPAGNAPYFITYSVIPSRAAPFTPAPALSVSTPDTFPRTLLRKSSKPKTVTITNKGNLPISSLSVGISTDAASDFTNNELSKTELAPGESTEISVEFRPTKRGTRHSKLTVNGIAKYTQQTMYASQEEILDEYHNGPPPPTTVETKVSETVDLKGRGVAPKPKPRPRPKPMTNTPRFPVIPGN